MFMSKQVLFDEILERNPQIDKDQLEESQEMLDRLRESGVQRKGYDLAPPFGVQRVSPQEDARVERRILRLRYATGVE